MYSTHSTFGVRGFLALVALIVAPGVAPDAAAAAGPCWKKLLDDWDDGRIEATYPKGCYRTAIRHLPTDAVVYSNAKAEITAALRRRSLSSSAVPSRPRSTAAPALASARAESPRSLPIAPIAVAAAALLVLACAVAWRAARRAQR